MKVTIFFCLLALAFAEKRMFMKEIIDSNEVTKLLDAVSEKFGTDATEHQCEEECHAILKNDIIELLGCPFACQQIEQGLQKMHSKTSAPPVPIPTQ